MLYWQIACLGLALAAAGLGFTGSAPGNGRLAFLDPAMAQSLFFTFFAVFLATLVLDLVADNVQRRTVPDRGRSGHRQGQVD